jgi:hypothetical protein
MKHDCRVECQSVGERWRFGLVQPAVVTLCHSLSFKNAGGEVGFDMYVDVYVDIHGPWQNAGLDRSFLSQVKDEGGAAVIKSF